MRVGQQDNDTNRNKPKTILDQCLHTQEVLNRTWEVSNIRCIQYFYRHSS